MSTVRADMLPAWLMVLLCVAVSLNLLGQALLWWKERRSRIAAKPVD
jgi:hypothetical protein